MLAGFLAGAVGCGPVWYLDPDLGERLAAEKNKPMLVYFKVWDSPLHRNMKLEILENAAVKRELVDMINVELEFAFFAEQRQKYGVQRPQVCVVCDSRGQRVSTPISVNPVPTVEKFVEWLQKAKAEALAASSQPAGS